MYLIGQKRYEMLPGGELQLQCSASEMAHMTHEKDEKEQIAEEYV
jgi:hypothetical protein